MSQKTIESSGQSSRRSTSKSSSQADVERGHLARRLTLADGISTIISLMVGSGIFSVAGIVQQNVGSPGMSLCIWLITGLLALTGALCYAELGTMIPGSGGEAQYLSRAFGPLVTYMFNWTSIVILKPGTVAILAVATAKYLFIMAAGIHSGEVENFGLSDSLVDWITKGIAILCCIVVTLSASLSTRWSNRIQNVLTLGKIGALSMVIGAGAFYASFRDPSMIRRNLGDPFGGTKITFSSFAVALNEGLWAFEGWNNLNIVAGDLINPAVNLPLSIWTSMTAVVILYLLTLLGYYAVLPLDTISLTLTIGMNFGKVVFGRFGTVIMPILIAASTFGSALSSMVTSSEIILLATQTGQMPSYFGSISSRFGTASRAYWMQGILASVLVLLSGFKELIMVYTFPTWIFYGLCVAALIKMRFTEPKLERPYRVIWSTPILFLVSCGWLLTTSFIADMLIIGICFGVVLLGIPLYYLRLRFLGGAMAEGYHNPNSTSAKP